MAIRKMAVARVIAAAGAAWLATSPAHAVCADPLRLMSFNIRLDTPADGPNAWPFRRDFVAGQIAVLRPDILGLQEVVANQKRDLETALPGYVFLGVARDDGMAAGEFSNLAIARAAFKVLESGTFWLSATPDRPSLGWDASYRRVVTWAHLRRRTGSQSILALNSHWDNNGRQARLESARLIRQWIASHRRKGEALVVMGDFNAQPGSPELLALAPGNPGDETLSDTSRAPSIGSRGSFNGFDAHPEAKQPETSLTIDHIFTSPDLEAQRHAVVSWTADGKVASDHFAVMADVRAKTSACQ
jgi:endonuclease/exonuclease/phosphatase family metal-dependent hydrolase